MTAYKPWSSPKVLKQDVRAALLKTIDKNMQLYLEHATAAEVKALDSVLAFWGY